jgi:UPF0716 family protein affecting phage T7 exclusion
MARQERMIVAGKVQIEMSAGERPPDALIQETFIHVAALNQRGASV